MEDSIEMIARSKKEALRFTSETYRLTFLDDRPFVRVESAQGEGLAELFVLSSVHSLHGRDDTTRIGEWEVDEQLEVTIFRLRVESSLWKAKEYCFRCFENRFIYDVEIEGDSQLAEVNYFGGYYSGQPRWGSGFFWSGQRFSSVFNSEPNTAENNYVPPESNATIDLMGVPLPGRDDWFFTPPLFCFVAQLKEGWLALGVETMAGQNRFTEYRYHGKPSAFHLSLSYDGQTFVNGSYQLPAIGFDFANDEYAALERHVKSLSAIQHSSFQSSDTGQTKPNWWRTPIFCGWGAQCYLASSQGGSAPDYARQAVYEGFLQTLDAEEINPGIVVLDDKWQSTYEENQADASKWHDLPGFIASQHAFERKVLLWLKAWDAEGLPVDECITNAAGLPIACDPSNPAFERRLRLSVRQMISAQGYDADGFKIDFTARIPAGPNLNIHGDIWGLELMRLYLSILHSEAKRIKQDALIMTHTSHPYLRDVVDMIRLNDINSGPDINQSMTHRARVAAIACPNIIIDTDDWPMPNKAAWRAYTRLQPELGVPSLYYVTHIDSTREALDVEDYQLIRDAWSQYRDRSNSVISSEFSTRPGEV